MAGSASRKRSAGHAPASVRGDDHLTIDLDHSMRADQQRHRLRHHQNGGDSSRARENEWTLRYALLSSDLVGWAPPPNPGSKWGEASGDCRLFLLLARLPSFAPTLRASRPPLLIIPLGTRLQMAHEALDGRCLWTTVGRQQAFRQPASGVGPHASLAWMLLAIVA